jgi:RNA polymerase sigma-70 factor (ECF subfamily)
MDRPGSDLSVAERLRGGDEDTFGGVVRRHHTAMVRFAQTFVSSRAVAEEVAQDAWIGVIRGIGRFEGRSSLSTWIFAIVANLARTRAERERRTVPASSLQDEVSGDLPAVPEDRFRGAPGRGVWTEPPARWSDLPESRLESATTVQLVAAIAARLPANQRRVFVLRDVDGWSAREVCALLDLSEANQRVLLHRARSTIRAALEREVGVRP